MDDSAHGRVEGVSLTQGWETLPVSRESKLESLLWSQAMPRRPQGAPTHTSRFPSVFAEGAVQGFGTQPGGGGQATPLSPFSRCRASVYRRQKPWLQERNPVVRAEPPRHGFQEAPFPRPLRMSHGRAGGCNRAKATAVAQLTGPAGKAPRHKKAPHQGFP